MYSSSMYYPLAPDPLPPGPQVTNPMAPVLRVLLRVFNVALAALSLLLIGLSVWMGREYHDSSGGDAPPPEPEAAAVGAAPSAASSVLAALVTLAAAAPDRQLLVGAVFAAVAEFPWFIYLVGLTGAYGLIAALCGLAGMKRERRLQLGSYIVLLALLVLAQAGATLLLLTENSWRQRIPDDPSGWWQQVQEYVETNTRTARWAAVGTLGVELAALTAACWLHAIYQNAYDAWLDDREEQSERARELLTRTVVQSYAAGSGSSWSARLRNKYGVEASALEATTNAARQVAALQDDLP